jgi:hypothetical protein
MIAFGDIPLYIKCHNPSLGMQLRLRHEKGNELKDRPNGFGIRTCFHKCGNTRI